MHRRVKTAALALLMIFLCACGSGRDTDLRIDYLYISVSNGKFDVICRVNPTTGDASPLCDVPACLHNSFECPAYGVRGFSVSEDRKTVAYMRIRGIEFGTEAEMSSWENVIMLYDAGSAESKEIRRMPFSNKNQCLIALDGGDVIFNEIEITKPGSPEGGVPDGNGEEFINRYYARRDGKTVLLKELKNDAINLQKQKNTLFSPDIEIDANGDRRTYFVLYDRDLKVVGSEHDALKFIYGNDKRNIRTEKNGSDPSGTVTVLTTVYGEEKLLPDMHQTLLSLDDHDIFYLFTGEKHESRLTAEGRIETGGYYNDLVLYSASYENGEVKSLVDFNNKAKFFDCEQIESFGFQNFDVAGGPKSGERFVLCVDGVYADIDEYGVPYISGRTEYAIIDAATGELLRVNFGTWRNHA